MANPTGKGGFQTRKHQINRKGRPKSFDALRTLAQQIAHECALDKAGDPLVISERKVTVAEAILRKWASSSNAKLQQQFIEVAFGKVPAALIIDGKVKFNFGKWKATREERLRKAAERDDPTD